MKSNTPASIFFFAHQDDEFGVYQAIVSEKDKGNEVICLYFTSGAPAGGLSERRNRESQKVLGKLGVTYIEFVGETLGIVDGHLMNSLQLAAHWIKTWIKQFENIQSMYVLAWEGGHPDHDSLHIIVSTVADDLGLLSKLNQFPLYNSDNCPGQFFKVLSPLSSNGTVLSQRISWRNRLQFLSYILHYKSQAKTFIGLFPFVFWHYIVRGTQDLQAVGKVTFNAPPHQGRLYYEKRGFSQWCIVKENVEAWEKQARRIEN